ncbi:MAG TPA: GNAT family N-acetyltransferase [Solirubrobacter sp.]|nr:GNAT family N-acetyltransferase [Solirubrobacter sp.]
MPELRPMVESDVEAVHAMSVAAFGELVARQGLEPHPEPDPAVAQLRLRHLLRTDPDGCWVTEDEQGISGVAIAILREGIWGLSLLVVRPDQQSSGVGSALLTRANEYADGARGRIILSSPDPRALRAYFRLGLEAHPSLDGIGVPRNVTMPDGIRQGGHDDIPFTAQVDAYVRGAAHGSDIAAQLEMGNTLLIAPQRGYAITAGGEVRLLAAFDDDAASELLRAALAHAGDQRAIVSWMTAKQQWAIGVCVEAGLKLTGDGGAVFVDGDVGPFTPYLPSGAFL